MDEFSLKDFLENVPPGKRVLINDFTVLRANGTRLATPQLHMHCYNESCDGIRFFEATEEPWVSPENNNDKYVTYLCRNCQESWKTFSLSAHYVLREGKWAVEKYGEVPPFGPPTPARAMTLIGGERELFILGKRCENQGMGIGAFVYYRRVLESQKNRILEELARVINKISPNDPVLIEIEAAIKEAQFTKAVESIKHALPQSLFINGHNPLTLLHSALSEGVHEHNDLECLEFASSIRTVLIEFAERLGQALKEEAKLNEAINRLATKKKIK